MIRAEMIARLRAESSWDVVVIGGGATGLGAAVDAAARGYRTVLLEQGDFAQGTSSRSTKLIHGGVRYLQQGNLAMVLDALYERGLLLQNAPHLVHHQAFVVPNYEWWEGPFYGVGLKFYDALAGALGLGPSRHLSRKETLAKIPTITPDGLRGGTIYYDGQFDDARMAITLAHTLHDLGGCLLNYTPVTGLRKKNSTICAVTAVDVESGNAFDISCRVVINATGIFADAVRKLDDPAAPPLLAPSQGTHIVLDRRFLPGETAIMVPHTDDGRVLFAVPWYDRVIVGTTDTPIHTPVIEPVPQPEEIDFLLSHAGRYLRGRPCADDVKCAFAGIRPLLHGSGGSATAALSRDHQVLLSPSGLVTVAGGKWTTYRKMGQDAVTMAARVGGLPERHCTTHQLRLHGWQDTPPATGADGPYGTDAEALSALAAAHPERMLRLHPDLPYRAIDVVWAVQFEMARTAADVLCRRLRALVLDVRAAIAMAPRVVDLMATELGRNDAWQRQEIACFRKLASGYLLASDKKMV